MLIINAIQELETYIKFKMAASLLQLPLFTKLAILLLLFYFFVIQLQYFKMKFCLDDAAFDNYKLTCMNELQYLVFVSILGYLLFSSNPSIIIVFHLNVK